MYDVLVIGGGHAGCEAAAAAARIGARVALVTMNAATIGVMSCNPSIGGLGKGHLVREIDACDGLMARAADAAAIHYRMLNRSKGPAVQGPRVQADRARYRASIRTMLAATPGITIVEGAVSALHLDGTRVAGVVLEGGGIVSGAAVIVTTGTFLAGRLHQGSASLDGGRWKEAAASPLARQFRALGLPMARLKTGTPPRLDGRTIDWGKLDLQGSDADPWTMSAVGVRALPQLSCGVTRTTERTHDVIRANLAQSPVFSGAIAGRGPRYCPSIEDKIVRFADRTSHQIFLEPEGLDDATVYPNGISTALPLAVQERIIATIPGLERARITQAGYAVEYDHVDPRHLDHGLRVRGFDGLYFAGQVNGTTGYEEAAAQGLVAGATAAADALGRAAMTFDRTSSYIGVMIDDLVLQGVSEPYRMLTARAEFRLRLRADNAGSRLGDAALAAGLLGPTRATLQRETMLARTEAIRLLAQTRTGADLRRAGVTTADDTRRPLFDWLRMPGVGWDAAVALEPALGSLASELAAELVIDSTYAPYVERQNDEVARRVRDADVRLGSEMDFAAIPSLSTEMIEKLTAARPLTLGDAARVRGVTPAALSVLLIEARAST